MGKKPLLGLTFVVAMLSIVSSVISIDDKCSACTAIAEELERGLMNERPKNHLDMRHRLDSKGQRQGRVIDYRVSELRVVDLLDGLCDKMQDYTLEKVESGSQVWVKVNNWDAVKTNKQEARAHSKDISSFCGRLLEETEDEVYSLFYPKINVFLVDAIMPC
ncbi:OLC1v1015042C2 [Oldenlandia corymbosa var. corymbosa]|uniref:OLC1v1015042C2 n=1 Tax=Oldenlandia corymbosa var. corymbosa TaxID=529605 RepID=A0AAV1E320_OLDCO|nr:OLC1v1015042C2 [Oldenlandia corymbosa var. corymbosa]